MAIKTSLRLIAREVSKAVKAAAQAKGLTTSDYTLFGSFDEKTDRINLVFFTTRPVDDRRLYADTFQELRRAFPHDPQITLYIGMVIRKVQTEDEIYRDSLGAEDETDISSLLERG